jgi:hypothetical protein
MILKDTKTIIENPTNWSCCFEKILVEKKL